jgi:formate-dependent nitrite reductase membrane component NrfD
VNVGLPDTYFTAAPEWRWLIVLYFFVGGIAGGTYFLAALMDFFGDDSDRPLASLAYFVAFPAVVLSGVLLIFDLHRPLRFWHMLLQSNTGWPMFKPWSPMSLGSWALLLFGGFAFLSFLGALAEGGRLRWPRGSALRPPALPGTIITVLGGLLGFFVAGYTGVLLSVTNRPIWADTSLLGLMFIVSAASISAALLVLLAYVEGRPSTGVYALKRFDVWSLVLELIVLIALVASLGSVARAWLSVWGVFLAAVVIIGILAPLALHWRRFALGRLTAPAAAVLVLLGGFLLRVVLVFASETQKLV